MNQNIKTHSFVEVQKEIDFLLNTAKENEEYQTKCIIEASKFIPYEFGVENDTYNNLCDYVRVSLQSGSLPVEMGYEEKNGGDLRDLCKLTYARKLEEANSYEFETLTFYNLDTAYAEEQMHGRY